jgi:hypothetical protein
MDISSETLEWKQSSLSLFEFPVMIPKASSTKSRSILPKDSLDSTDSHQQQDDLIKLQSMKTTLTDELSYLESLLIQRKQFLLRRKA